jgi:hypothetical protein
MKAAFVCIVISCLFIGAARVETRQGQVVRGKVVLDEGAVVVEPLSGGGSVRVDVDNLRTVSLRDLEPQPLSASNTGKPADPWISADLGRVHLPGSTTIDKDGTVTIEASGWGVWGGDDSLHWVYRSLDGDGQIVARVRAANPSNAAVVVGVMIRQDVKPDAAMAATCLYPDRRVHLHRRPVGGLSSVGGDTESQGDVWIRLARRGNRFIAYESTDGRAWQLVDSQEVPMSTHVLAGVGAWTTSNSQLGRATIDSVSLLPGTAGSTSSLTGGGIGQGVILTDGDVRAGTIVSADDQSLFLASGRGTTPIPRSNVARLILGDSPGPLDDLADKTGVLLGNGDFIEGEVTALTVAPTDGVPASQRKITVTSSLFGVKEVDLHDVVVALFREVVPSTARYKVRTSDGSVFHGGVIDITKNGVRLDGSPMADVVEIEVRQP